MKILLAFLLSLFLSTRSDAAEPHALPDSPWKLAREVAHAYEAKDREALRSLICWDRTDSTIRAMTDAALDQTTTFKHVSVRFKPLTVFDQTAAITEDGTSRTYRYNLERVGCLEINGESRERKWMPSVGRDGTGYRITLWSVTSEPFWQSDFNRPPTPREWLTAYYRDDPNGRAPNTYLFRDSSDMAHFYRDALALALEDEKLDTQRWRTKLYYPVRDPQSARGKILQDLGSIIGEKNAYYPFKPYSSSIALPAVTWCLSEESERANQDLAIAILGRIESPLCDSLVVSALSKGVENPNLATAVLSFADQRRIAVPRVVLLPYIQHHRPSVAGAARALNDDLGYPPAPAFKPAANDTDLADIDQKAMGKIHGYRMIIAFSGNRDYPSALKEAKLIVAKYPKSAFGDMAKEMMRELPLRMDDFKKLRLPTPEEWTRLRSTMSREEQIQYLCERFRLLSDSPQAPQFAEPPGMDPLAYDCLGQGETPVINPLIELEGPGGLHLTASDVPALAPFLQDNWFIGGVEQSGGLHYLAFSDERTLYETCWVLLEIIESLVPHPPFQIYQLQAMSEADRETALALIIDWAGSTRAEDGRNKIVEAVNRSQSYWDVESMMDYLVEYKVREVVPKLLTFIDPDSYPTSRGYILASCRKIDAASCVSEARKYLMDPDPEVRFNAGLIVYASGDKMAGLMAIAAGLDHGACRYPDDALGAASLLLADNGADERDVAELTLNYVRERAPEVQLPLVRTFSAAHHPAGLEFFLQELTDPSLDKRFNVAKVILDSLMQPGEGVPLRYGDSPENQSAGIASAKEWVTRQIAVMKTP
jgi:hypothetical protein